MPVSLLLPSLRNPSNAATGIALMVLAMMLLPAMDIVAKLLSASMSSGQAAWSRFAFQALYLLPVIAMGTHGLKIPAEWHLHGLRGVLIATATLLFFTAITSMPVADAIAIFFVEPLLLTLMSPFFLGEKIGWRRVSASLIGFVGALIIIQPGQSAFGAYAVLPLGAALCFAFYLILTRKLAQRTDPVAVQFFTGVSGFITLSLALLIGTGMGTSFLTISAPSLSQWGLMALLGAIGCVGHLLVVMAFRYHDASLLAPLQYLEIVSAVLLGWLVFRDFPTETTWLGIAIIIGSGIYVYWRERRANSRIQ